MPNLKSFVAVSGAVFSLALSASTAGAQSTPVDPQLYVCTGCTSSPSPNDPVSIDPASINVGFAGSGNNSAIAPLLIIVGVPNQTSGTGPTLSLPSGVMVATGSAYYGLNNATSGTTAGVLEGTLMNVGGTNAYMQSGLATGPGGGSSENNSNWFVSRGSNSDGSASAFGLYAYAIQFTLNDANSPLQGIDFTHIALGSYVIAYNCSGTAASPSCPYGETPFTVAGLVTTTHPDITTTGGTIPEPSALALLGSALAAMGFIRRRRKPV